LIFHRIIRKNENGSLFETEYIVDTVWSSCVYVKWCASVGDRVTSAGSFIHQ